VSRVPGCTALASLPAPADLDPPGALERLRDAGAPWLARERRAFAPHRALLVRGRRSLPDRALPRARRRGSNAGALCTRAHGWNGSRARSALAALRALLPTRAARGSELPFCAAPSAWFGYELAEQLDVHRLSGADDLALPDAVWLFVDALIGFDHEREPRRGPRARYR
jgi:anthranilate/para-aminobenzoate synthase component I